MSRKSIILFSICCLAAFLSVIVYFLSDSHAEKAVPVVNTLSSDQLLGLGYTEASAADTHGVWEDNEFSYSGKSAKNEASSAASVSFPIDINAASADELIQIKGIGSATAEKIISYRTEHGCFYSVDELLNVDGIGSKTLSKIKNLICVDLAIISEITTSENNSPVETYLTASSESKAETVTVPTVSQASFESQNIPESPNIFPIELNTASAEELMEINGVGESIAEAIVEYARSVGFSSKNDLMNVPGIGEKRFENISPYVYVEKTN